MEQIQKQFLENGYVIIKNESLKDHNLLKKKISEKLELESVPFNQIHKKIDKKNINKFRLSAYNNINSIKNWELVYLNQAKSALQNLIGLDISIQTKLNLSVQMPGDETSTLLLHTDTLSGQSEFEVVLWVPFTNCYNTNSMYIFNKETSSLMFSQICKFEKTGMLSMFNKFKKKAKYLTIMEDECLIFSPSLFHGNTVNETKETRVSINCRFKSILAPEFEDYPSERKTGPFYRPIQFSPVMEYALNYNEGSIKF